MRRILLLTLPTAALLGPVLLSPAPALAQFSGGAAQPTPAMGALARPPPSALPGLSGRRTIEPIPATPNQNLSPNAALFDAINRGDLPAARDAVGRGADLDARNVLGLTPIDSAVDQARHEILFYLLSARSSARNPAAPPEANMPPAQRAARERQMRAEAERAAREAARAAGNARGAAPAPAGPRLFAGDGGTAQPDSGFLGFDAGGRGGGATRRVVR